MNLNAQTILALLPVLGVIVPAVVVLMQNLVARLPAPQQQRIAQAEHVVGVLVSAAEQVYAKAVPGSGAYKKAWVLGQLAALGLKVDPQLADALIEAAVYGVNAAQAARASVTPLEGVATLGSLVAPAVPAAPTAPAAATAAPAAAPTSGS